MNLKILIVYYFALLPFFCSSQHINGLTSVATPDSFPIDPYPRIKETCANWICLVPYGFSRVGQTEVWYNMDRQWWGEKRTGVITNIKLAKQNGFKVFLKPQIYIPGSWPGELDFDKVEQWQEWELGYKEYIMSFVDIAIEYDVELFCIGTEFKNSVIKRNEFWVQLISEIRCKYAGELTYSSNWDNYQKLNFWNELDYIGISSYFPLTESKEPSVNKLIKAWKPKAAELKTFASSANKKVLFTEYGYLSVDGCAGKTWELEKKVKNLSINEQAQANAFEALYATLWHEDFWAGGFIWKWFPLGQGHEGYIERDYTPQDKKAENVLKKWFKKG